MDILEKNDIVITLQEAKDKAKAPNLKGEDYAKELDIKFLTVMSLM